MPNPRSATPDWHTDAMSPSERGPGRPPLQTANTARARNGLEKVRMMTNLMREHQEQITKIGVKRREQILKLREQKVTYAKIAEAMGTTEQAVYKVIRGDL